MAIEVKHSTQAVGTDAGNGEIAKTQWNEAHAINMATARLLGRTTAGAGAAEEISVGSGLSLSAGTLSASGGGALTISNKSAAYTVVAGDLGTIINCSGATSFTVSLTAAATLGAGFNVTIWNNTTTAAMAVTIDPSGAETVDGVATLILRRGEGMQIVCDGTNWQTGDKKTMRAYAENIPDNRPRPIASGDCAIALGIYSTASGVGSTAIAGNSAGPSGASATANGAIAIGAWVTGCVASASQCVAIGVNSAGNGSQAVIGVSAMALGGSYASGTDSFAAAVANNTSSYGATGANSIAIGRLASAGGNYSYAGGNNCSSTASASFAFGEGSTAQGAYSVAFGGYAGSYIYGKFAHASGRFASVGDAQLGLMVLRQTTNDAVSSALTSDANAASTINQVICRSSCAIAFTGTVVARRQSAGGTESAAWKVEGLIRREANAASTTLVASTVTAISNAPGWTLALSADTTNGGLAITATGAAATNIRWVATVQTSEVTYA